MLTLTRIVSLAFAATVLMVIVSVCGDAVACSACPSETCCVESSHTPPRRATTVSVMKLGYNAATADVTIGVPLLVAVELPIDGRTAAPPPDLLLANLRV